MAIGSLRSGSAGRAALSVEQVRALQETFAGGLRAAFVVCALLAAPATPKPAFGLSQPLVREGGSSMHITLHCTRFSASGWQF
jgi:hypothetical protein